MFRECRLGYTIFGSVPNRYVAVVGKRFNNILDFTFLNESRSALVNKLINIDRVVTVAQRLREFTAFQEKPAYAIQRNDALRDTLFADMYGLDML